MRHNIDQTSDFSYLISTVIFVTASAVDAVWIVDQGGSLGAIIGVSAAALICALVLPACSSSEKDHTAEMSSKMSGLLAAGMSTTAITLLAQHAEIQGLSYGTGLFSAVFLLAIVTLLPSWVDQYCDPFRAMI